MPINSVSTSNSDSLFLPIYNINIPNYAATNNQSAKQEEIEMVTTTKSKEKSGKSTLTGVMCNYLNAMVGAGILGIPVAYSFCGIFGGIGLMLIFSIICTYTLNLMIIAGKKLNVTTFENLGYECFGLYGYIGVSASMFLLDYGAMLTMLIILGDSAFAIINIWGYNTYFHRQMIILIVSIFIILPLCLKRDIAYLEKFSFMKIIALLLVTAGVIFECVKHFMYSTVPVHEMNIIWFNMNGIPYALGIFAFCFVCHDTAFLYYESLKDPTYFRWSQLTFGGTASAMLVSVIFSVPAYLTFTDSVKGNILNNYGVDSYLMILIRALYVIAMALSYPIPLFVVRHICYGLYIKIKTRNHSNVENENVNVKNAPLLYHILFSSVIFFSTLIIALFVDNLGNTMSIVGSLSSVNLAFMFPCIFYIKSSKYKWSFWSANTRKQSFTQFIALYPPLFLAIFGIFIGIYAVVIS